jgi:ATP-dependent Clp protease ATP-binding subunit ClpA
MGWFASAKEFLNRLRGQPAFTPRALQVFALARKEAERLRHNYIGTEHVLLGLIKLGTGVAFNVFETLKLDSEHVWKEVEGFVGTGTTSIDDSTRVPFTPRVKKVLAFAREEARALRHTYVGTEHLLLGLLREGDGIAAQVLRHCGADLEQIRVAILKELNPYYESDDRFYTRHFADLKETAQEAAKKQQFPQEQHPQGNSLQDYDFNFTPRANQVLALARKEADRLSDNYFGTEHLLMGLIELGTGVSANVLVSKGMTLEKVRTEVGRQITRPTEKMFGNIPYAPRLNQVIGHAREEARALNHTYIGTDHLLLGLLRENDGPAADVFKKFGVDMEALRQEILKELKPPQ